MIGEPEDHLKAVNQIRRLIHQGRRLKSYFNWLKNVGPLMLLTFVIASLALFSAGFYFSALLGDRTIGIVSIYVFAFAMAVGFALGLSYAVIIQFFGRAAASASSDD